MSSQLVSGITDEFIDEGETFNFSNWIIQNDLVSIKDLFVKHEATTLSTLKSLTSPQLQAVMKELFTQPQNAQMMMKIMNGVQKLLFSAIYYLLHPCTEYISDSAFTYLSQHCHR